MNHTHKKRFIAGAVCPRCSAMDTIMMFREDGVDVRKCADCDFEEKASFDTGKAPAVKTTVLDKELPTRVNKPVVDKKQSEAVEKKKLKRDEIQVVKIIEGLSSKKD